VPVTPIILNSVTIRRVGAAAEAFDIHAQELPLCLPAQGRLRVEPGVRAEFVFDDPRPAGFMVPVFRSPDLNSWTKVGDFYQGPDGTAPQTLKLDTASLPRAFYQIPMVFYPNAVAPTSPAGVTLDLEWEVPGETESLRIAVDQSGTGGTVVYSDAPEPGSISFLRYTPGAYDATWIVLSSGLHPLRIWTYYESSTDTEATGSFDLQIWSDFSGWQSFTSGVFSHNR
jgi:hypothetical protein